MNKILNRAHIASFFHIAGEPQPDSNKKKIKHFPIEFLININNECKKGRYVRKPVRL